VKRGFLDEFQWIEMASFSSTRNQGVKVQLISWSLQNFERDNTGRSNKNLSPKKGLKSSLEEETIVEEDLDSLIDAIDNFADKVKTNYDKLWNNNLYASKSDLENVGKKFRNRRKT